MTGVPLRSAALAWATPLLCEAVALARNVMLARLLGAEEMGKLMLLAFTLRLVEMASDLSLERLTAQAEDGGALRLQRTLHGLAVVRGIALAAILAFLAGPVVALSGDAVAPLAVAALALSPVLRGFVHLDARRFERAYDYRATFVIEVGTALAMLAATPLAILLTFDHRAFAIIAAVQALSLLALSHVVARRRYRIALDTAGFRRALAFGLPLTGNAALLFLVVQGDRLLVTAAYDWATIGAFAVAVQLALLPALVAGRAAQSLLLPRFRRARAAGDLARVARRANAAYAILGLALAIGFGALAPAAIGLIYGEDFVPSAMLAGLLGIAAGIRLARSPLSQLAVSLGRTGIPGRANLMRAGALAVAGLAALLGLPIETIALAGALGELAAGIEAWRLTRPAMPSTRRPRPALAATAALRAGGEA